VLRGSGGWRQEARSEGDAKLTEAGPSRQLSFARFVLPSPSVALGGRHRQAPARARVLRAVS
jgi:hypothetical protein